MNHERAELIDAIRAQSRSMQDVALKMAQFAWSNELPTLGDSSILLVRHSLNLESIAKGLEE